MASSDWLEMDVCFFGYTFRVIFHSVVFRTRNAKMVGNERQKKRKASLILEKLVGTSESQKELTEIEKSFSNEGKASMKPYYRFMLTWLILFAVGVLGLSISGVSSALEISMIVSF